MTDPATDHGQKIKNTLKYAEQRRTLWLNTHTKDEFGRHRSAVLYGMNVTVTGPKTVKIQPGAVVTPYGTRFFFEQYSSTENPAFNIVDLSLPIDLFSPGTKANYPVVACIYLRFIVDDPTEMTTVDSVADFDTSKIQFGWRVVPHDQQTVQPSENLRPRDPILLDRIQNQEFEYTSSAELSVQRASAKFWDPSNIESAAMQFGEIPLAYVIVGCNPDSNVLPSSLTDPGVEIAQCKNLFSTLGELLGHDIFYGRHGRRVTSDAATAAGTALRQGYDVRNVGTNTAPDMLAPKYGTTEPDSTKITPSPSDPTGEKYKSDQDKTAWTQATWDTYRQPSMLRDGDGVVWALRRLDYMMRLWMDRTGDQSLVATVQDGQVITPAAFTITGITLGSGPSSTDEIAIEGVVDAAWVGGTVTITQGNANDGTYNVVSVGGTRIRVAAASLAIMTGQLGSATVSAVSSSSLRHVRQMMQLDAILQHFKGNDDPLANINVLTYPDGAPAASANPSNHTVKSGRAAHVPQTLPNVVSSGYGDTHLNAISALDLGVWHTLGDIFGRAFVRRALRITASWRTGPGINIGALGDDADSITAALTHDDGPTGVLPIADANADGYQRPENVPTFTGAAHSAYLTHEPLYDTLRILADRAQAAPKNWLRNPNFVAGDLAAPGDAPVGWAASSATLLRVPLVTALQMSYLQATFTPGGELTQTVDFANVTLGNLLNTCNILHVAIGLHIVSGSVRITLHGLTAGDVDVFTVTRNALPLETAFRNYGWAFKVTDADPSTITKLKLVIHSDGASVIRVLGASVGPGVPETSAAYERNYFEFLSRDGGLASTMRGPIQMGGFDLLNARDGQFTRDVGVGGALTVGGKATSASTADVDTGITLTTKDYVLRAITRLAGPNYQRIITTGTIAVPTILVHGVDIPANINRIWIYLRGGTGGYGGITAWDSWSNAAQGGPGGEYWCSVEVPDNGTVEIYCGPTGEHGYSNAKQGHKYPATGAGGGGATRIKVKTQLGVVVYDIVAGGGGGGKGMSGKENHAGQPGADGGAGGSPSQPGGGHTSQPGNTDTVGGGTAGTVAAGTYYAWPRGARGNAGAGYAVVVAGTPNQYDNGTFFTPTGRSYGLNDPGFVALRWAVV